MFLKPIIRKLQHRWNCESGYREVLVLAIPLILSTRAWTIQHFVDRMFLTWYSPEAIAAAMPAGILNFTVMSFFIGTAGYVSTFVAQYYGAKRYENIGPSIWQGMYLSVMAESDFCFCSLLPNRFFDISVTIVRFKLAEVTYFRVSLFRGISGDCLFFHVGFFFRTGENLAGHVGERSGDRSESDLGLCDDFREMGLCRAGYPGSSDCNSSFSIFCRGSVCHPFVSTEI